MYDEFVGITTYGTDLVAITKRGKIWHMRVVDNEAGFKIIAPTSLIGWIGENTGESLTGVKS